MYKYTRKEIAQKMHDHFDEDFPEWTNNFSHQYLLALKEPTSKKEEIKFEGNCPYCGIPYENKHQLECHIDLRHRPSPDTQKDKGIEEKYYELIMAVGNKYEGETRHETALRYIKMAERGNEEARQSLTPDTQKIEKLNYVWQEHVSREPAIADKVDEIINYLFPEKK